MSLLNFVTSRAISSASSVARRKLEGEPAPNEKTTVGGGILRFFISFLWVLITFIVTVLGFYSMMFGMAAGLFLRLGYDLCFIAMGASFVVGVITFLIPYLRKKGSVTRSCASFV